MIRLPGEEQPCSRLALAVTEALLTLAAPSLLLWLQEQPSLVLLWDPAAELPGAITTQYTFIIALSFQSDQASYPPVD